MSAFTKFSAYVPAGGLDYMLTEDLEWYIGDPNEGPKYVVQAGAIFNVSIPTWIARICNWSPVRWLCQKSLGHSLFDPHDPRYLPPAALHDDWLNRGWDRVEGGAMFRTALLARGVGKLETFVMWLAVSLYKYR